MLQYIFDLFLQLMLKTGSFNPETDDAPTPEHERTEHVQITHKVVIKRESKKNKKDKDDPANPQG
jgi:hypothetical protein